MDFVNPAVSPPGLTVLSRLAIGVPRVDLTVDLGTGYLATPWVPLRYRQLYVHRRAHRRVMNMQRTVGVPLLGVCNVYLLGPQRQDKVHPGPVYHGEHRSTPMYNLCNLNASRLSLSVI